MSYHEGEEIAPGYEVVKLMPGGPLSENYVVRDSSGMFYELELVPASVSSRKINRIAYRSLTFISGLEHTCLPKSMGTVTVPCTEKDTSSTYREVPLWEHPAGRLTLYELIEAVGGLHPAQAAEVLIGVCDALLATNISSRNATGNPFPHLALSPANIALRENRVPIIFGWGNRALFLAGRKVASTSHTHLLFLDPAQPAGPVVDRRHDVYALAACLFFLLKGYALPSELPRVENRELTLRSELCPLIGTGFTQTVVNAFNKDCSQRPNIESFYSELNRIKGELAGRGCGGWKVCSGCGLMMRSDADLCPLCVRDRILPTASTTPSVFEPQHPPLPISSSSRGNCLGVEAVPALLSEFVFKAASHSGTERLSERLKETLRRLCECGLREFAGDLLDENGSLRAGPYWVACELAHRISPESAKKVVLAGEKGAFSRWLQGRERSFRFKKTLRTNVSAGDGMTGFFFRGRLYFFAKTLTAGLWRSIRETCSETGLHIILVLLEGNSSYLTARLPQQVTIYTKRPPSRSGPVGLWGSLDEYRLFCLVRGCPGWGERP